MAIASGIGSQVGYAEESSYGTYVAPTRFLEHLNEGIELQVERISSGAMRAGSRFPRSDRFVVNRKGAAGSVGHEVASKGFGMLFLHALGAVTITTPGGATNTRDHTHTPADLAGKSLTVQVGRPQVDGTVRAFSYLGGKIASWELSNSVDGILLFTPSFDFYDESTAESLAIASYPAGQELFSFVGATIEIDSTPTDVTDFSLTYPNGLKTDRYMLRGSSLKKQPIHATRESPSGSLTVEFESMTLANKFASSTASGAIASINALWRGSLIESSFYYEVKVTLAAARLDGSTPRVEGPDVIRQQVPFVALDNGTDPVVQLVYRTTDTAS